MQLMLQREILAFNVYLQQTREISNVNTAPSLALIIKRMDSHAWSNIHDHPPPVVLRAPVGRAGILPSDVQ